MKVTVSTPTRIDLAGGTLDIYPLYVFEGGGITVNCAIDLACSVEVSQRNDAQIVIYSADLDLEVRGASAKALVPEGPLDLVARAVRFCAPRRGLNIVTRNTVPKGSGLGASSSLLVALMGALARESGNVIRPGNLIDWCANVEAQSLGIPTGKQDYYAAYYGGLNAIFFDERGIKRESLKMSRDFMETLRASLVLSYTGISHFSGATNWDMMKSYIDNAGATRAHMKKIKQTAIQMRESLLSENINAVAGILAEEWENRKRLAVGVSNEMIDSLMRGATRAGAMASKICGAGAGGCMVTITAPENRKAVMDALEKEGARILPFSLAQKGLKIVEEP